MRRWAWMRTFCELQLYALVFALPFEFNFGARDHYLYTNLKFQALLLMASWTCLKLADFAAASRKPRLSAILPLPTAVLLAIATFVVVEVLAAALAPEFRDNALKSAVKGAFGAVLCAAGADLIGGSVREGERTQARAVLLALALSGSCVALIGLAEMAGLGGLSPLVSSFQPNKYWIGNHVRFVSTMEYPNTAGSLLGVSMSATLALTILPGLRPDRTLWPPVSVGMLGVQGVALALTYSRGALGATLVAILVATWLARKLTWQKNAFQVLAACLAVLAGGAVYQNHVRFEAQSASAPEQRRMAHYGLEATDKVRTLSPGRSYQETIAVQNDSPFNWRRGDYGVGYRWHRLGASGKSPLLAGADFGADVPPTQRARISVQLATPRETGEYLLIWFVYYRSDDGIEEIKDSFSPGILHVIGPARSPAIPQVLSEQARGYIGLIDEERRDLNGQFVPGRWELWSAALKMFRSRPWLGMGPDNFRILKWEYMEVPKGDETILANSLYLELLSGSGLLGMVSFLWLVWESAKVVVPSVSPTAPRRGWVAGYFGVAYLAGLVSHGAVDYFLKFTPTFLLFWLMLGLLCAKTRGAAEGCGAAGCDGADRL